MAAAALRETLTLWAVALFWNGLLSVFVWQVYVHPWRARRLVRGGEPTTGMIRSWSAQPGKGGPSYRLTYEYEVPGPSGLPETRTGKMTTRRRQAADWRPGRPVTVVYNPAKPWRSVIYALGDYRAVVA